MTLTYSLEPLRDVVEEIKPLVQLHWQDVSDGTEGEPDPDYDKMIQLEELGIFKLFTARDEGRLVGYVAWIIAHHLHYRTLLFAHDDAFFLHREYRRGGEGIKLFEFCENALREMGVKRLACHEKIRFPLGPFFIRLGFRNVERNWFKDLE